MSARAVVTYKGKTILVNSLNRLINKHGVVTKETYGHSTKHKTKQEAMAMINTIFSDLIDNMLNGESNNILKSIGVSMREDAEVNIV